MTRRWLARVGGWVGGTVGGTVGGPVIAAIAAVGAVATGASAGATTPPTPTTLAAPTPVPPPTTAVDTSFVRAQAEAQLLAEHPDATQVACSVPPADAPGVRFLCYGSRPDGSVLVLQATMNDDGGLVFEPVAGGGPTTSSSAGPTTTTAAVTYDGSGSAVVQVTPISGLTILTVGHDGAGDVTVQPQHAGAAVGPALTAAAAAPSSRFLVGLDGPISAVAVTASGAWTIGTEPTSNATVLDAATPAAGASPDVVRYAGAGGPVAVSFDGTGPIVVGAVTAAGRMPLVDATGPFAGTVTLPPGPGFVTVEATGGWTLTTADGAPTASAVG